MMKSIMKIMKSIKRVENWEKLRAMQRAKTWRNINNISDENIAKKMSLTEEKRLNDFDFYGTFISDVFTAAEAATVEISFKSR